VDLGTGDGRFVLAHATAHPDRFVLGLDAVAEPMRDASRRAARPADRGGLPNARFVVSALNALPAELDGVADLVTVHFPWGSLRDVVTGQHPDATERLLRLARPDGALEILVADGERDRAAPFDPDRAVADLAAGGWQITELRPATLGDAVAVHSSWGKRLLRHPSPGRSAWRIRLAGPAAGDDARG
jgi:16S rRNA (adenine(1408)-N(1))-methyltransferase